MMLDRGAAWAIVQAERTADRTVRYRQYSKTECLARPGEAEKAAQGA
jgi:hypothetical protein